MKAHFFVWIIVIIQFLSCGVAISNKGFGYKPTDILIIPPVKNRRGFMGGGNVCPKSGYAIGLRLKMHNYVRNEFADVQPGPSGVGNDNAIVLTSSSTGKLDNTALNGVRLKCSRSDKEVKSAEGTNGLWTDFIKCQGNGDYITGFRVKSENWLGWGTDDVGSTNVEAVCKSGAKLLHRPMPTWINDRGDWGAWAKCPDDAPAVCGIKSRIDNGYPNRYAHYMIPDKRGDKAGITEIQLKCCEVK